MGVDRGKARRALPALLAAGLLALATGCGDDEDEPAGSGSEASTPTDAAESGAAIDDPAVFDTDPCALLTDADVEAILGKSVKGELQVAGDAASQQPGQCLWESGEPVDLAAPNNRPFSVSVSAGDRLWFENNISLVEGDDSYEQLDGLADAAFAADTRGGFLAGSAGVTVELGIAAEPASHDSVIDALERAEANYEPPG